MLQADDLAAISLTMKLATTTTAILLLLATPLAWWLARNQGWWAKVIGAVVTLPLVLPPTVIGFYLLIALGPQSGLGQLTQALGLGLLPFTFWGLVLASIIYSLPFAVQPLQQAFAAIGARYVF
jgi:molybdate transport system permease protein